MLSDKPLAVGAQVSGMGALLALFFALLAALPALGLGAPSIVLAQGPVVTATQSAASAPAPAVAADSLQNLWNQYDNVGLSGITSQKFANGAMDSFAADDFVILPGDSFSIITVEVDGSYSLGTASAVNVYLYANNPSTNLPGTLVSGRQNLPYADGPSAGDFVITLSPPVVLGPGHYWLSVQAIQSSGQWYWADRTVQSFAPAAWTNPGGGWGAAACLNWQVRSTTCGMNPTETDQVFRLSGNVVSQDTRQFCNAASVAIPDSAQAALYPSNIGVSGIGHILVDVNVVLNRLTHTYPRDLDLLLVGPQNQKVLFFSDVGYYYDLDNTMLVVDDQATSSLPDNGQVTSGRYRPTNYSYSADTFASPAPAAPYSATLAAFNGTDPNGTWHLYIMDNSAGDSGSLNGGWCLQVRAPMVLLPILTR